MANKAILSAAILKSNWDIRGFDYIENFVPLFKYLLRKKAYSEIDINELIKDFEEEFGLRIPYHPTETILTRLKKQGYIRREQNNFYPSSSIKNEENGVFEEIRCEKRREINKLTQELVDYCLHAHSYEISENDAGIALISFFQENELSLLSAADKTEGVVPTLSNGKTARYYVAKFIENAKEANPESFKYLVNLAVGVALANTIIYGKDFQNLSGKIANLSLYLDTAYIFSLLGINGTANEEVFKELTNTMLKMGVKLFVFEHTYDEMVGILNNALFWMNQSNYDTHKASRTLRYFLENDYSASDVEFFMLTLPRRLDEYKIQKCLKPSYTKDIQYQIDERELKKLIVEDYSKNDPFFEEVAMDETINKDIESLYSICKLRKGKLIYAIRDAGHLFVTANRTLARISRLIQGGNSGPTSIPPAITVTLMGTLVWLQNPPKTISINEKKLIADAYAAVQPDAGLIKKYLDEVNLLNKKGGISDSEYFILRTNRVAYNLLSEKTANNVQNFRPMTTTQILDEINKEHLADLNKKLEENEIAENIKKQEIAQLKAELEVKNNKLAHTSESINSLITSGTDVVVWVILGLIIPLIAFGIIVSIFPDEFSGVIRLVTLFIFAIASVLGFSIFRFKDWLQTKIEFFIRKKFCGEMNSF